MQVTFDPERYQQPTLRIDDPTEVVYLEMLADGVETNTELDERFRSLAGYIIIEAQNFRGEGIDKRHEGVGIEFVGNDFFKLVDFLREYPLHYDHTQPQSEARRMLARQCWQTWGPQIEQYKQVEAA